MPDKKNNLSSEVGSRLRQAVLKDTAPIAKAKTALKRPSPKKSKNFQKKSARPVKIIIPAVTPAAPPVLSKISLTPKAVSSKKLNFRNVGKSGSRAWEKSAPEESLEKMFQKKSSHRTQPVAKIAKAESVTGVGKSGRHSHPWLKIVGLIVLLLILLLAFDVLGLYEYKFNDSLSHQVAQTLNLPAGRINGQPLALAAYLDDLKLLTYALSQQREGLLDFSSQPGIENKVLIRLAAIQLIDDKLKNYHQTVSSAAVDNQLNLIANQAGGQSQAGQMIKSLYGLTIAQFKEKILLPMMMRDSLQTQISQDDSLSINVSAKTKALQVLKLAEASSSDFSALAKQYTDDDSSVNTGGDLGWVVKGQLDPTWEQAIFSAPTSTVINQLFRSRYGYHVIKVEQRLTDPTTKVISVKLRHILIKVDVDQYIKDLLDQTQLVRYVK